MPLDTGLQGKKAIITGAGRGIGAAIAERFAAEGAEVVLAARSDSELKGVAETIAKAGGKAHIVPTDLGDEAQVERLAAEGIRLMGGVDVLVSNAAYSPAPMPLLETPIDIWKHTQQVNLTASLILAKALVTQMAGRPGSNIVIVSSIRGLGGTPFGGSYGASKAALNQMIKTLACEIGPMGVRINGILPGPVETKMTTDYVGQGPLFDWYGDVAPLKGWTQAEDMVGGALYLTSPMARKVTGHLLVIDGGLSSINYDAIDPPAHLMEA